MGKTTQEEIKKNVAAVYKELKERDINPKGQFDSHGRWYSENGDLISCRSPSRAWPYSQMSACRTKKYVTAVQGKFKCKTVDELRTYV